jgi:hypothetical protein
VIADLGNSHDFGISAQPCGNPGVSTELLLKIMKNSWIFPVAALVVGAAGGYISGKGADSGVANQAAENSAQRTRSANGRPEAATTAEPVKKVRSASIDDIARMPGNSNRVQALLDFYANLTPEQLAEEATKLENLPITERMMASFLLFGRWAEVDPTAAMAFSNTMGMAGNFVRPTVLQSWASVDPANAAKYYSENPREFAMMGMMGGGGPGGRGGPGGQSGAAIIAGEWARQDPAGAMAWAATLTTEKGQAMNSVVTEIAKTDPRKAAEMIGQMDADDRGGAYRSVAAQYGALDFAEAQTWIRTLPADEQATALASAVRGLSGTDPAAAGVQLNSMEEGEAKERIVDDVIVNLARKDPEAAATLLKQQESEEAQRDGMRELMSAWTIQNPTAALAYANSFEQGSVRDSALQSYVWSNASGSPAETVKVAAMIDDDGDRDRAIGIATMRWMREDPTAAKAYVESSTDLSDEAKERITEGRGMWGGGGRRGQGGGGGNRGQGGGGNRGQGGGN